MTCRALIDVPIISASYKFGLVTSEHISRSEILIRKFMHAHSSKNYGSRKMLDRYKQCCRCFAALSTALLIQSSSQRSIKPAISFDLDTRGNNLFTLLESSQLFQYIHYPALEQLMC